MLISELRSSVHKHYITERSIELRLLLVNVTSSQTIRLGLLPSNTLDDFIFRIKSGSETNFRLKTPKKLKLS